MTTTTKPTRVENPSKPPKPVKEPKPTATQKGLVKVGAIPRADLLPPEIRAAYRGKAVVRMLIILVITVAVVVAGGVGYASIRSITSQAVLQLERDRSADLQARQLDFAEARQIANQVDEAIEARKIATAAEIDWKAYLDEVSGTLPEGVSLRTLAIAPIDQEAGASGGEPANPLQQESVAAITITAFSATVPDVESWFDDLEGITGFAGIAPPATVTEEGEGDAAGYTVSLELLVNEEAYLLRFQDEEGE